jgi:NTP pyrophosphatase (non-canonical NTP hydrolase)
MRHNEDNMARNNAELLVHANIAMMEKLNENKHKPSWDNISLRELLKRLRQECAELDEAVDTGKPDDIRREAADVANFAAMIILFCDKWKERADLVKGSSVTEMTAEIVFYAVTAFCIIFVFIAGITGTNNRDRY